MLVGTQTDASEERPEMQDQFVSRINYNIPSQEERARNEEPPTTTRTQPEATLPEASHHETTEGKAATVNQTTIAETEEDAPLFRKRLQRVLGATKKDRNLRPLITFVKKGDWDAIKSAYGQYWFNVYNRLHKRDECLLIDERIIIPTQLRQTILDSLHLTHPGSAAMLDLCQNVWLPHIHRSIVQMAKICKHCTEQSKNLKPIIGNYLM